MDDFGEAPMIFFALLLKLR